MVTLEDVKYIYVAAPCLKNTHCRHFSKIQLIDGRSAIGLDSFQIWSLISGLANEKINPKKDWQPDEVRKHFESYNTFIPSLGKGPELPEVVLNTLFSDKNY